MEFGIERYSSDSLWIFFKSLEYKNITVILFGFFSRKIQGFSSEGCPSYICYEGNVFNFCGKNIAMHIALFIQGKISIKYSLKFAFLTKCKFSEDIYKRNVNEKPTKISPLNVFFFNLCLISKLLS